jgi:hypothetical protein
MPPVGGITGNPPDFKEPRAMNIQTRQHIAKRERLQRILDIVTALAIAAALFALIVVELDLIAK